MLYASSLDNPFVYDDFRLIVENPAIQNLSGVLTVLARDITRPLVSLSYVADTAIWGTGPFGYHLTNVLLHALNVVLAYWVAFVATDDWRRRMEGGSEEPQPREGSPEGLRLRLRVPSPKVVATVTGVLTAAHPVMTQAVGYITARSELLYGAFFLGALLAGRHWMRAGGAWRAIAIVLWCASLLAKETAAMLPVLLWCYDAWLMDGAREAMWRRVKSLYAPLLAVVVLLGAGRLALLALVEYGDGGGPNWRFLLVSIDAFWQYFALFVRPHGQTIMHTVPFVGALTPRMVASVVGLAVFAAIVWRLRRIQGPMSFGLLMAAALLVPGSVLFITGIGEPMAEHRAYVSAMGFFLACGAGAGIAWSRAVEAKRGTLVLASVGLVLALQLSGQTLVRNQVWGSPVALAREAVTLSPNDSIPRLFLGETLRQQGRCDEAVPAYQAALAMRVSLEDFTRQKLAACLTLTGAR